MIEQETSETARLVQLLNGWWDFQPVAHPNLSAPLSPNEVPTDGWEPAAYLVPSLFTDHAYPEAWRSGGSLAQGFQVSWTHTVNNRSGWMRTHFTAEPRLDRRAYLTVGAAIPQAHIFVNGHKVAIQDDMFFGEALDVTELLHPGENELAIFLTEFPTFPHPDNPQWSLIDHPWGCCITTEQAGIWQDVTLEWRPVAHVENVTIRTSVREHTLTVITRVTNPGCVPFEDQLQHIVEDDGAPVLTHAPIGVVLAPGETKEYTVEVPWTTYRAWTPHDPYLYHLRTVLGEDTKLTRFGFREVWIDGHRVLLNGVPQRWRGEWAHKAHSHWLRPEYVRQWFQQLKDLHCNYARMHTFPHPEYFLDIADEMGILVCQESALHGSHPAGHDTPELWTRAWAHANRMVRRDKNHPSLVLWSVENEMRWALNIVPGAKEYLPKLRAHFNELDPTRPAYHDGDSSLWDERTQPMISRHYGAACHGLGWWEKDVPLHAGEVGSWHYASPFVTAQFAGDEVYAEYQALSESMAKECARVVELGRANEVTCLFFWNTSGLDNFRPAEEKSFTWAEPNSRYLKPLKHTAYESEYAWWEEGHGYRPGWSFDLMRRACRPLAVVIREERTQAYNTQTISHTVYIVNDLPNTVEGEVCVRLEQDESILWHVTQPVIVPSGETAAFTYQVPLANACAGTATLITSVCSPQGDDTVARHLTIAAGDARYEPLALPRVALWGATSTMAGWLSGHGVAYDVVDMVSPLDPTVTPLLIVGEQTVVPGSPQNQQLHAFVQQGGRALVLEQTYSIFPGVGTRSLATETAHIRDTQHPVWQGITVADLQYFGDDPYGLPSSNSTVTQFPFEKPRDKQHLVLPLADCSRGGFGSGGLNTAPLIEARIGTGLVIASQFRLADRMDVLPVADILFRNILHYLAAYTPPTQTTVAVDAAMAERLPQAVPTAKITTDFNAAPVAVVNGEQALPETADALRARIAAGQTVIVCNLDDDVRGYWEQVVGAPISLITPEHTVYQLVRGTPSRLLAGISHEDTCWLTNWVYCWSESDKNTAIVERLLNVPGGVNLLQNATRSGLDVLYGDDLATEWKRMSVLSRYFDTPQPHVGGGLVEVPVGAGRVLFWQINWRPDLWRFHRVLGLLLQNLGVPVGSDILAGDCVPASGKASDGFPVRMRTAPMTDQAVLDEVLGFSHRHTESYSGNAVFHGWPHWQMIDTPDGTLNAATMPGTGTIIIGMDVGSPEPRKFMETIGGLPNPDLQTFLRLRGAGRIRAWVNTVPWGDITIAPGETGYIPDIDFETGSNFVILSWEPSGEDATLSLCFENKDRRPEMTFNFW